MQPPADTPPTIELPSPESKLARLWARLTVFRHWSRKQKIVATAVLILVVAAGLWLILHGGNSAPASSQSITQASDTVASPLTGEQVKPALAARPVTGIMIENSTDARPQSGLQSAGVVFEAEAEGGITRFLALYQEAAPQYIGPVRSLRIYYFDWAKGFQASIAHVGGSPDALSAVRSNGQRDLDEFFNAGSYWRITSRLAPHNVYTSFDKLDALNKSKGYIKSSFTPWPRKADSPLTDPTARDISITTSGYLYNVSYKWDAPTNTYYRWEGGARHMEITASGKQVQIHPNVVIAMTVPLTQGALDASDAYYSNYHVIGHGGALIFQDGGIIHANWSKQSVNGPLTFTDAKGNPVALNIGQTWITAVTSKSDVGWSK